MNEESNNKALTSSCISACIYSRIWSLSTVSLNFNELLLLLLCMGECGFLLVSQPPVKVKIQTFCLPVFVFFCCCLFLVMRLRILIIYCSLPSSVGMQVILFLYSALLVK